MEVFFFFFLFSTPVRRRWGHSPFLLPSPSHRGRNSLLCVRDRMVPPTRSENMKELVSVSLPSPPFFSSPSWRKLRKIVSPEYVRRVGALFFFHASGKEKGPGRRTGTSLSPTS